MNKLIKLQRSGALVAFIVGDMMMGMYRWVIKDLTNSINIIDGKGKFLGIRVSISLEEYV